MNSHDPDVTPGTTGPASDTNHASHTAAALSPLAARAAAAAAADQAAGKNSDQTQGQHGPALPPGTGKLGMWLFLAALVMLFGASLVAYIFIRITGTYSPKSGTIHMPLILWGSTFAMLASSITMHMALSRIRKNLLPDFKKMMAATVAMAVLFLCMQVPGLWILLSDHYQAADKNIHIYGLVFVLVLLHAAHILGGLIPLAVTTYNARQNAYTQKDHNPILYLTMYWHFLDGVWLLMFAVFLIMR